MWERKTRVKGVKISQDEGYVWGFMCQDSVLVYSGNFLSDLEHPVPNSWHPLSIPLTPLSSAYDNCFCHQSWLMTIHKEILCSPWFRPLEIFLSPFKSISNILKWERKISHLVPCSLSVQRCKRNEGKSPLSQRPLPFSRPLPLYGHPLLASGHHSTSKQAWHAHAQRGGQMHWLTAEWSARSQGLSGKEDTVRTHMHHDLCSVQDGKKQKLVEMMDHAIMGKKLLKIKTKQKAKKICEYLCGS